MTSPLVKPPSSSEPMPSEWLMPIRGCYVILAPLEDTTGVVVSFADYDALRTQLASIRQQLAWHRGDKGLPDVPVLQPRYDALRAENERLRTIVAAALELIRRAQRATPQTHGLSTGDMYYEIHEQDYSRLRLVLQHPPEAPADG